MSATPSSYATHFPDFPADDMPAIPASFVDVSWHNDASPCFVSDTLGLELWVDYADPAKREYPGFPRYRVYQQRAGVEHSGPFIETDSWDDALMFIAARGALS
jgi:hypothetical protein